MIPPTPADEDPGGWEDDMGAETGTRVACEGTIYRDGDDARYELRRRGACTDPEAHDSKAPQIPTRTGVSVHEAGAVAAYDFGRSFSLIRLPRASLAL